ncbi:05eeb71f-c77e-4f17-999d-6f2a9aed84c6 [Thermothielavioides terrestris]|uniref:05eeb71f-c77e-4f17-999d-6f2a9aed84c6 n=1 Tax=Thermothielavioides terrestris TaxID=2587410 RepID=A0A446B6N2_9PEZI|nr:05eeb71f-c77e-4f17-999d-6f2a9aed84c6 [Thermothielavioides terrestris]
MNFHNFAGPAVVRNLAKENPELVTQVVVVLTRPDQALSVRESKDLLSARLKLADLYINQWQNVEHRQ